MTAASVRPFRLPRLPRLRGLPWVTWRQHRLALAGMVALLAGLGAVMVVNGRGMHHTYRALGLDRCGDLNGAACRNGIALFDRQYAGWAQNLPVVLGFIPLLVGVFVGAPLVAREWESGTYRFAWTQGRGRTPWLAAKLALLGTVLTGLALAFTFLFAWWYRPWEPILGRMATGDAYEVGIVFAGRTLFCFLLGALLGTVIRRTVPAMAATGAAALAVWVPSAVWLRPLIQHPLTARKDSSALTRHATTVSQWVTDPAGHRVSHTALNNLDVRAGGDVKPGQSLDFDAWLARHHYTQWVSYQPDSRYWHFQLVETAGYLALALLLAAAALWHLRRRAPV
ncbi:MAG: hypothetical protein ACJ73S_13555 [Mycobacteriales bacterium]